MATDQSRVHRYQKPHNVNVTLEDGTVVGAGTVTNRGGRIVLEADLGSNLGKAITNPLRLR